LFIINSPSVFSPIHHTYGPHVDHAYMARVLALSYAPWAYRHGKNVERLRKALEEQFHRKASLYASGREALLTLLRAIDLKPGEEVIVQGYTCVVVPNAIHCAGGLPVFANIDRETLNLDYASVEPLISSRTRAVICQHTFGIPADVEKLRALCSAKGIFLIEDCAHVLPDGNGPREIGRFGDAMILSFGRDKAISGVTGGAILVRDEALASRLKTQEGEAIDLPWMEVVRLLEYAPRMRLVRSLLWCGLQRPLLTLLKLLGLFVPILTAEEKRGYMSPILHRLPNACAALALYSLKRLPVLNKQRRTLNAFYLAHGQKQGWPVLRGVRLDLPLQKFPLFVRNAQGIRAKLKKHNIHLDDGWTGCVVCPESVNLEAAGYEWGDDPVAEQACEQILSLPTHPTMTMKQAEWLTKRIDEVFRV
jgi:dTDP-4-amino-4,6-dideoxygalactose transaminase